MKMSTKGLKLLMLREGSRNRSYKDTKGIWTIGVGHTGPEVVPGLLWTDKQIVDQLALDVLVAERALEETIRVDLTQDQTDALCSFIFNVGVGAFKRSTMLRLINLGKFAEAAQEFDKWHIPPEITSRRNSERDQFRGL